MKNGEKRSRMKSSERVYAILLTLCLILAASVAFVYAADIRKLQNGSFEEGQTFTKDYLQTSTVANWNTTAFQGQFELFRDNPNT